MAKLALYNKLGSAAELGKSIVGGDGTATGFAPSYLPCKFGNGIDLRNNTATSQYVSFGTLGDHVGAADGLNTVEMTLECWWKAKYDWDEASPSGGSGGAMISIYDATTYELYFGYNWDNTRLNLQFKVGSDPGTAKTAYYDGLRFAADDLLHFAVAFDTDGNIRVFVNGGEVTENFAGDSIYNQQIRWKSSGDIRLGWHGSTGTTNGGGVVDNLKVFDYVKTDFSGMEWEKYPPSRKGDASQYDYADTAPAAYETTSLMPGKAVEVPEPDHYWKLDEAGGDVIIDYGTKPVNGVNNGLTIDRIHGGYDCTNATGTYRGVIPNDASLQIIGPMTLCFWMRRTGTTNRAQIISKGGGGVGYRSEFAVTVETAGGPLSDVTLLSSYWGDGTSNYCAFPSDTGFIETDKWIFVAIVRPPNAFECRFYKDGHLHTVRNNYNSVPTLAVTTNSVVIGYDYTSVPYEGNVKNIRLYSQDLNSEQIGAIYEQEVGEIAEADLVTPDHHYPLDSLTIADKGRGGLILPAQHYAADETEQTSRGLDGGLLPHNMTLTNISIGQAGKHGMSFSFNGGSSVASAADHADLDWTGPGKTVCIWCNLASTGINCALISKMRYVSGAWNGYGLEIASDGDVFDFIVGPSSGSPYHTAAWNYGSLIPANRWFHVAGVWADDGYLYLYVNGELKAKSSTSYTGSSATSYSLNIGKHDDTTYPRWMNGLLDDARTYHRALSQQEIISVMNDTDPRRLAYGTLSAAPPTLVYDLEIGECLYFNGSSNSIELVSGGTLPDLDSTDEFEVSYWLKLPTGAVGGTVLAKMATEGYSIYYGGTGICYFYLMSGSGSNELQVSTVNLYEDDLWHHWHITYDGSKKASGVKIYVDAALVATSVVDDTTPGSLINTNSAYIGAQNGSSVYLTGYLKDLRIWKK